MTAGIRAGASNDAFLQVNSVDVMRLEQNGRVTRMISSGLPVLRVTRTSGLALVGGAVATVACNSVLIDTVSAYNTTTGRYTPQQAGNYSFSWNGAVSAGGTNQTNLIASLYLNGAEASRSGLIPAPAGNALAMAGSGSTVLFLNGSTDYVELRLYVEGTGVNMDSTATRNMLCGFLVG